MENVHSNSHQTTFSPSSLLCKESQPSLDEEEVDEYASTTADDDEYVQMLLDREITNAADNQHASSQIIDSSWLKEARYDAVEYILNTRALFGFKFQTAYLSVTYLDRFLSRRQIGGEKYWAIRLLAMACLSLAAKMEEYKVPALSDLPMEDYYFESRVIQRMELLVLSTLDWRMGSVTPFTFIDYYVSRFCNDSPPKNIKSRILEVILGAVKDVNLMSYRPSAIAAAATLITLDPRLTREALEIRLNGSSSSRSLNHEDIWPCYNQLQHIDIERFNSSKGMVSPPFSPIQLQNLKALDKSSSTLAVGGKRKRLGFNDSDQNCDLPNEKQHTL